MTFFTKVLSVGALVILLGFSFDVNSAFAYTVEYTSTTPVNAVWDGIYFGTDDPLSDWTSVGEFFPYWEGSAQNFSGDCGTGCRPIPGAPTVQDLQSNSTVSFDQTSAHLAYAYTQNYYPWACDGPGLTCHWAWSDAGQFNTSNFPAVVIGGSVLLFDIESGGIITAVSGIPGSEKQITSFNFENLDPVVIGVVDEVNHTINLTVPYGTDLTNLVPTISISDGASVTPSNNVIQDFSSPVTYIVTGSDGSTENYVVAVTPFCVTECYSNVLFLPGISGSRMYENTTPVLGCTNPSGLCEAQRWLTNLDSDIRSMYLNSDGSSQKKIYTRDVIDAAGGISNIYKSLLSELNSWKVDRIIEDYAAIPYDWRLAPDIIINNGHKDSLGRISYTTPLASSETPFILGEVLRLSESSKTKKVTIVAHSYGGLITKQLMLKLRELGKENLVDQIIFVAVPEVGTPDAMKTLLHGSDVGPFGVISNSKLTREFSQNLPGVYNLLPSSAYYSTNAANTPIASFDNSSYFNNTRAQYGNDVNNFTELQNYLQNLEGRTIPVYADINHANTLNLSQIYEANTLHQTLDSWIPSQDTQVTEIAGWGEYTLNSLKYRTEEVCLNRFNFLSGLNLIFICTQYGTKQVLGTELTLEGDGTVVNESAHYLSDKNIPNAEKWWVDLDGYNKLTNLNIPRDHKNILEVTNLLNFISNKIINSSYDTSYVSQIRPSSIKPYTKIQLNSPLTLDLYDDLGNHTGLTASGDVEENIPGSRYETIGESKYILVPKDIHTIVKLKGYEEGSFSLELVNLVGDMVTNKTTFSTIPSSITTKATVDLPANVDISPEINLKLDFNGDNTIDLELPAKPGEVVKMPTIYNFSGFLQPINDTKYNPEQKLSVFKAGSTVPVKFQLKKYDGSITQAGTLPTWLTPQKGSAMSVPIDESVYTATGTSGNAFRWDATSQQYSYNWSTKGLTPGYWYKISAKLDDGNVYFVTVGLR